MHGGGPACRHVSTPPGMREGQLATQICRSWARDAMHQLFPTCLSGLGLTRAQIWVQTFMTCQDVHSPQPFPVQ